MLINIEFLVSASNAFRHISHSCLGDFMWQLDLVFLKVFKNLRVRQCFGLPVLQISTELNVVLQNCKYFIQSHQK